MPAQHSKMPNGVKGFYVILCTIILHQAEQMNQNNAPDKCTPNVEIFVLDKR